MSFIPITEKDLSEYPGILTEDSVQRSFFADQNTGGIYKRFSKRYKFDVPADTSCLECEEPYKSGWYFCPICGYEFQPAWTAVGISLDELVAQIQNEKISEEEIRKKYICEFGIEYTMEW